MKVTLIETPKASVKEGFWGEEMFERDVFFPPSKMFVKFMSQTWGPKEMINETCW